MLPSNSTAAEQQERSLRDVLCHPSPFVNTPPELLHSILRYVLKMPTSNKAGDYNCTPLLLSSSYYRTFQPVLYASVHITGARQFRLLRETLVFHNASVGKLVKRLTIASTVFDNTGYIAEPVTQNVSIGHGIEHFMLEMPNLTHLALDLYTLASLTDINVNHRLDCAPRIRSLKTELTFPQYLDLPIFEDLEDLEIVCFGLDKTVSETIRTVLPRLKRLTIRLVHRSSRSVSARPLRADRSFSARPLGGSESDDSDGDSDGEDIGRSHARWSDTTPGRADSEAFIEALDLLRSWPNGDRSAGTRLESITVLTWPAAVRELHEHYGMHKRAGSGKLFVGKRVGTPPLIASREGLSRSDSFTTWKPAEEWTSTPTALVVRNTRDLTAAVERQTAEILYSARHYLKRAHSEKHQRTSSNLAGGSSAVPTHRFRHGEDDEDQDEAMNLLQLDDFTGPLPGLAGSEHVNAFLQHPKIRRAEHRSSSSSSSRSRSRTSSGASPDRSRRSSMSLSPLTQRIEAPSVLSALAATHLELPPAPMRIDLDPYRGFGPRQGSVKAWMEEV